ncbi:MAG TPA: molybdopterin molybdenumtransferase MoeA, partial [Rhizobiales bacterium]|nr:molybdopterin molybdenumtransferase MoeA [Hyphomicrobiales bacterium]
MMKTEPGPGPDDCFAYGGELMRHDDAIKMILERTRLTAAPRRFTLAEAAGKILAAPVIAPRPIPAFNNAAMDGYAMAHASLNGETRLPVTATVAAGHPLTRKLEAGEAVRIFTGAKMPEGADTVVMQEVARPIEQDGNKFVIIPDGIRKGANHRLAGEDVAEGAELVSPGTKLRPQDIAAIASTGTGEIECYAPLRVALVSSGDEIIRPGEDFRPGAVYDSNTFLLRALLAALPVTITDLGILPDRFEVV